MIALPARPVPARADAAPALAAVPAARINAVVRLALYLFVASIPFEMPDLGVPLEIPTLTGMIFLASTALHPTACYRRLPLALACFAAYLWVLGAGMAIHSVEQRADALKLVLLLAQMMLLLWAVYNALADQRAMRGVLLALLIGCSTRAAVQVLGIATTTHEVWTGGERVTAFGQNANLSAMILSAGLVTAVGLRACTLARLPRLGLMAWLLAGVMAMAVIQSGSRGGLLCAAVGLLMFSARGKSFGLRVRNALFGAAAVGALGWAAYRSDMLRHRFEDAEAGHLAGRERIYPSAIEMFREKPLLGWGPVANQYEIAKRIDERRRASRDAHNLLLELLTTGGVVGALPFLAGLGLCLRAAWRSRHGPMGAIPLAVLAAVLVGTVSGTWIASKILWLALSLALAAGAHWSTPALPPSRLRPCAA
jgi:O-antigen ligase